MSVCPHHLVQTRTKSASTFLELSFVTASQETMKFKISVVEVNKALYVMAILMASTDLHVTFNCRQLPLFDN